MSHVYAYGVVPEDEEFELERSGVGGAERIYTVTYRSLSAVVSDIDTTDPERTDEAVETHNDVLQSVLESDGGRTVVPMGFGMAFKDARTLKGVVRGGQRAFRTALSEVEGTVELGLKLVSTGEGGPGRGEVEAVVEDTLGGIAIDEVEQDRFSDRLLVNRAYLVDRDDREAFDAAVDDVEAVYDGELIVRYTGPWAPYNFVDIRIGTEGR
jgi:hypothetical protein